MQPDKRSSQLPRNFLMLFLCKIYSYFNTFSLEQLIVTSQTDVLAYANKIDARKMRNWSPAIVKRCYGKIYWFFPCVLFGTYLFVNFHINHFKSFHFNKSKKCIKNNSSFWIDFCCYSLSSYAPACRHFCYLLHGFLGKYKC